MEIQRTLNAVYLKAPGYIYDLIFMFLVYFNKDHILNSFVNYDKAKEVIAFYNKIFQKVSPVPEELNLFFHMKDGYGCLISSYYFCKHANLFLQEEAVTVKRFTDLFRDGDMMTQAVIKQYFPQEEHEKIEQMSIKQLAALLKETDYTSELKYQILNYYIHPEEYINLLIDTMLEKETILREYRHKYKELVELTVSQFDVYETVRNLKRIPGKNYSIEMFEPIYYSLCILHKFIVKLLDLNTDSIALLGIDYPEFLEFLLNQKSEIDITKFGKIVSEENRIKILDMLIEREEITKNEVVNMLNISMTATHYHMDMMVQAKMLTVRNEGRTMYHKLNPEYFGEVFKKLKKYYMKG